MFIDWVANFIWGFFEDDKEIPFNRLMQDYNTTVCFFND